MQSSFLTLPTRARPAEAGRVDEGRLPGNHPPVLASQLWPFRQRQPTSPRSFPARASCQRRPGSSAWRAGHAWLRGLLCQEPGTVPVQGLRLAQLGLQAALGRSEQRTTTWGLGHLTAGFWKWVQHFSTEAGGSVRTWSPPPHPPQTGCHVPRWAPIAPGVLGHNDCAGITRVNRPPVHRRHCETRQTMISKLSVPRSYCGVRCGTEPTSHVHEWLGGLPDE